MQVIAPDLGINGLIQPDAQDLRGALYGSENLLYENGTIFTAQGFAKLGLTTAGLNSGDIILGLYEYRELDGYTHLIASTTDKIYVYNKITGSWDDKTQSGLTMLSDLNHPISCAIVAHNDTNIHIDDDVTKTNWYYHLIVSDGGNSDIQRWAGRYESDFSNLAGGDGYHDGTAHRALQVGAFQNRLILLSPKEYSSSFADWVENNQRVRWPVIGKLQTWTGTGSGFVDLVDTGGTNVWSGVLGSQYIIYQTRGIWSLNYVGGSTIFSPVIEIPDLGLLASNLFAMKNSVHYFVGNDYNVYAYYGGTLVKKIGDKIRDELKNDITDQYMSRCRMCMGSDNKRLHIYVVPSGSEYITKEYVYDLNSTAWMVRDFKHKYSTGGITAVTLVGSDSYTVGDTYNTVLNTLSPYDISDAGDATLRYGDKLLDYSRTLTSLKADLSTCTWSSGGFDCSKAAGLDFTKCITNNDILMVYCGSKATNTKYGTHFYTIYDVSQKGFSVYPTQDNSNAGDRGIAEASNVTPSDFSISSLATMQFYSPCSADYTNESYNQKLQEIYSSPKLCLGDSTGFVYQYDASYITDDGVIIPQRHITPILDLQRPDIYKRWPGMSIVACGTIGGAMYVSYRTDYFDTSETGWTDFTFDLTSEYRERSFWFNTSSQKIQCKFSDFSGKQLEIRSFNIFDPIIEDNR